MKCKRCGNEALFEGLCEPCFQKKFNASFLEMEHRGLIERHGENWRITEKGKLEKDSWDEAWEAAKPDQDAEDAWVVSDSQWYRDIMKQPTDYQILEGITEEQAKTTMLELMKKVGTPPQFQYAFNKTGFIATDDNWEKLGKAKQEEWEQAIQEYQRLYRGIRDKGMLQPLPLSEVPRHFTHDACLRCCRQFKNKEVCFVVKGGSAAKYRDIALEICQSCFQGDAFDEIISSTVYVLTKPLASLGWPEYYGSSGIDGYARLGKLSNGVYRIAMHRGHVEVYTASEMERLRDVGKGDAGYSKNYQLYGWKSQLGDVITYTIEEERWVDLSKPEKLRVLKESIGDIRKEIPQSEQWAIVYKLKNGETCVANKRGYIDVVGYEEAKDFVSIFGKMKPGTIAYTRDGLRASMEALGQDGIPAVGCQAVPRTDYDPKKHDTFHLRLGPSRRSEAARASLDLMEAMGLLVDFRRPSSAFDVMASLEKVCQQGKNFELLRLLYEAHPIVWTPQMTGTAYQAVCQLKEALKVESDLIFINPALWLYTVPCYEGCPAEHAMDPFTDDGHVPFPDEVVGDLGAPIIAILFHLTNTEILGNYFYLLRQEPPRLEIRSTHLKLGSQPTEIAEQTTLKWLRFAASPYLIVSQHHVERHVRRRVQNTFPQVSGGVGVILLRRAERLYEAWESGRVGAEVDWSCQWWVSGHWRRQWYPSTKTHKPVWVAPYIKGPPDKPLKDSVRLMVR